MVAKAVTTEEDTVLSTKISLTEESPSHVYVFYKLPKATGRLLILPNIHNLLS